MKMNSPHAREISEKAAEAVLKDTGLKVYTIGYGIGEIPPVTASEDFFFLLLCRPGAFWFIAKISRLCIPRKSSFLLKLSSSAKDTSENLFMDPTVRMICRRRLFNSVRKLSLTRIR